MAAAGAVTTFAWLTAVEAAARVIVQWWVLIPSAE